MRIRAHMLCCLFLFALVFRSHAQTLPLDPAPPKGLTIGEIIAKFAAKELEFKRAREQYTYRQSVKVQTILKDKVDGEYQEVFDVTFDDKGKRVERIVYAPPSTLSRVTISMEDLDDIRNRLPFVLTSEEIPEYSIAYAGSQHVDELDTYVFDVSPKAIAKGKRYFEGRIWVEATDLQIVKTYGKTVPDIRNKSKGNENLFPAFTTYREQIDQKYWFPTYTHADDVLHFSSGDVRIREIVKYANYKRFTADVKITVEDEEIKEDGPSKEAPKGDAKK